MNKHYSVMLNESIQSLNLKEDSIVIDATLGAAGHSSSILRHIKRGYLIAFEQDSNVIEESKERLSKISDNYQVIQSNFTNMKEEVNKLGYHKVNAILFDLGTSSMQMDDEKRGFNYHFEAELDMRMNPYGKIKAKDIVNTYSLEELNRIFRDYSDEKYSYVIAKNIVKHRSIKKINTTWDLVNIIKEVVPAFELRKKHPARKVFQALRIEVNGELEALKLALKQALEILNINGRLAVITFQTKEDIIVKHLFNEITKEDPISKGDPNLSANYKTYFKKFKKLKPSKEEIEENYRSRSAILRVVERIIDEKQ